MVDNYRDSPAPRSPRRLAQLLDFVTTSRIRTSAPTPPHFRAQDHTRHLRARRPRPSQSCPRRSLAERRRADRGGVPALRAALRFDDEEDHPRPRRRRGRTPVRPRRGHRAHSPQPAEQVDWHLKSHRVGMKLGDPVARHARSSARARRGGQHLGGRRGRRGFPERAPDGQYEPGIAHHDDVEAADQFLPCCGEPIVRRDLVRRRWGNAHPRRPAPLTTVAIRQFVIDPNTCDDFAPILSPFIRIEARAKGASSRILPRAS